MTEQSSCPPVAKNSNTNKQQQSKGVHKIVAENEWHRNQKFNKQLHFTICVIWLLCLDILQTDLRRLDLSLQTITEDIFIWSVGPTCSVNPPFKCTSEILLLTYLLLLKSAGLNSHPQTRRHWWSELTQQFCPHLCLPHDIFLLHRRSHV